MLDIKFIRENVEAVKQAVQLKRVSLNIDDLMKADKNCSRLSARAKR